MELNSEFASQSMYCTLCGMLGSAVLHMIQILLHAMQLMYMLNTSCVLHSCTVQVEYSSSRFVFCYGGQVLQYYMI